MLFSQNLKKKRQESGLKQQEIADMMQVNRVTYTNWENGKREPTLENVVKLAKILKTTTDNLLVLTIYSKLDLLRFLDDFDVSDIKNFEKDDVDKLKFAIMFEMTRNKVNALNLKDDLILKYKLDKNEREILNTIFSEVQDELLDLVRHRK